MAPENLSPTEQAFMDLQAKNQELLQKLTQEFRVTLDGDQILQRRLDFIVTYLFRIIYNEFGTTPEKENEARVSFETEWAVAFGETLTQTYNECVRMRLTGRVPGTPEARGSGLIVPRH